MQRSAAALKRGGSSSRWTARQARDPFRARAVHEDKRSRAAFKLEDLDRRFRLLRPGARIVDLGAAPGGFSAVAAAAVGRRGRVVAVDLLEMEPLPGVQVLRGDFTEPAVREAVLAALGGRPADVLLSDMAPSFCGDRGTDHARQMELVAAALDFAAAGGLRAGGAFLAKALMGSEEPALRRRMRAEFKEVKAAKPPASRKASSELFLVGRGFSPAGGVPGSSPSGGK